MTNNNKCPLCGEKLEERGKIKKKYSVKQFGKNLLKVCDDCSGNVRESQPQPESEKK